MVGFPMVLQPRMGQDVAVEASARLAAGQVGATPVFGGPVPDLAAAKEYAAGLERPASAPDLAGRTVIAADAGATRELVVGGEIGLLALPGDVAAVETPLRRLLDDPDLAKALGRNANDRALRLFYSETALNAFERICEDALSRP